MPKREIDNITEEKVSNGGVLLKLYFDIKNKNKESLQPLLLDLVNQHLLKEHGVVYCFGSIEEPIEIDGVYSTSAAVTVLIENLRAAIAIIFRYAPAGIELIRPTKELGLRPNDIQSILMDVSLFSNIYSEYIIKHALNEEGLKNLESELSRRVEIGQQLMKKDDSDTK